MNDKDKPKFPRQSNPTKAADANQALIAAVSLLSASLGVTAATPTDAGAVEVHTQVQTPKPIIHPATPHLKTNQLKTNQLKSDYLKTNQLKTNQLKSDYLKTNQLKANQLKSDYLKTNQLKTNQLKSDYLKTNQLKATDDKPISDLITNQKK